MRQNKSQRVLFLLELLLKGKSIHKKEAAEHFDVDQKSIQRDIDELRTYFFELGENNEKGSIEYDRKSNKYKLQKSESYFFSEKEILALAKILLESRAFTKAENEQLLRKLILKIGSEHRQSFLNAIMNESHHYVPPQHNRPLLDILWEINEAICEQKVLEIIYRRTDGKTQKHLLEPQGLLFSEYYFYLAAQVQKSEYDHPAIFRLDRITKWKKTEQNFRKVFTERFQEGEYRKRIQFMYEGELLKIKFSFWGTSPEAVLDRLPTARILDKDGKKTIFEAEVFGRGIKMWLLSQGATLEVLAPENLRQEMREEGRRIMEIYGGI